MDYVLVYWFCESAEAALRYEVGVGGHLLQGMSLRVGFQTLASLSLNVEVFNFIFTEFEFFHEVR
jgi:hypothetical protein